MFFHRLIYNALTACILLSAAGCGSSSDSDDVPEPAPAPSGEAAPSDIIMEVNPRLYGGDGKALQRVTAHLGDIARTGATVLWLMPVNDPGQDDKSIGSPYCVRDYKGINTRLGTLADFKALVNAAHSRGMRVILDWVANHSAWDCAWISSNPEWYEHDGTGNIISPSGWSDVASLNYDNADMRRAMTDAMLYWITETEIDGFRFDHVDGVPHDYWTEAVKAVRGVKKDALLLAESSDERCFADGFDMVYGWSYAPDLANMFAGKRTSSQLNETSQKEFRPAPDTYAVMRYAINHDTASESGCTSLFGGLDGQECATAIAMFSGGTPMIYTTQLTDRTGRQSFFTYEEAAWSDSRIAALERLGKAYKATAAARGGNMQVHAVNPGAVTVYKSGSETALLVANPSGKEISVRTPIELAGTEMTDALAGGKVSLPAAVTLQPYGYKIFTK